MCSPLLLTTTLSLLLTRAVATGGLEEFTSADGKFKVLLPGKPTEKALATGKGIGPLKEVLLKAEGGSYTVRYADVALPTDEVERQRFLDVVAERLAKIQNGKLTKRESITLDNKHPGRLIEVELPGMKEIMLARVYFVGRRQYVVQVVGTPALISSGAASRFLTSFILTP